MHKVGESVINYIKKINNAKALDILVRNSYSGYQWMHTFLYTIQKGGKTFHK